eukprot:355449-Chlamydomonas_euryale.AAC.1
MADACPTFPPQTHAWRPPFATHGATHSDVHKEAFRVVARLHVVARRERVRVRERRKKHLNADEKVLDGRRHVSAIRVRPRVFVDHAGVH